MKIMRKHNLIRTASTKIRSFSSKSNLSLIIGVIALVISGLHIYYQFFHIRNELLYTYLTPEIDSRANKIVIPLIYKNNGNQNAVVLGSNIELEVKPDDGSENYFRRLGDQNDDLFPLIISPGDYKTINLEIDYMDYHKGMIEYGPEEIKYREMVNIDNLKLELTTQIISKGGVSEVRRRIGRLFFRPDKQVDRINFEPIKMVKLEAEDNREMINGSVINMSFSKNISGNQPLTQEELEWVKFLKNQVDDSLMIREFDKIIKKNNK